MIMNKTTKIDESIIVIAFPVPSLVSENLFKESVPISTTYAFSKLLPVALPPVAAAVSPSCAVSSPVAVSSEVPSVASPPVA